MDFEWDKFYVFGAYGAVRFCGFRENWAYFKPDCIIENAPEHRWRELARPATVEDIRTAIPWLTEAEYQRLATA